MRNFKHLLLLVVVLIAVLPAQAQVRDGRVRYGSSFDGYIASEDQFSPIAFTGNAGDVITITVTAPRSATLDPVFYVIYGDIWVAFNDDAEDTNVGAFNSQVKDLVLPHDGTYDIYVGGYSGTGDFTVSIEQSGSIQMLDAYRLSYGDTLTGDLDVDNNFFFSQFEGVAGDEISVSMVSTDTSAFLDTLFYIYDSEFFPIAVVDDSIDTEDDNYDAVLNNYVLPATGTYYIVSTRFEGSGSFSMTLSSADTPVTATTTDPATTAQTGGSTLTYGSSVTGFIDATTNEVRYTFDGVEGEQVTITMVAEAGSNLDSVLRLLGPNASMIAENDDAADTSLGRFNSQIVGFTLPTTGTFTIIATRFSGSGNFTVSLDSGSTASSTSPSGEVATSDGLTASVPSGLVFDLPTGWVFAPMSNGLLIASSDDVLARAQASAERPDLVDNEVVIAFIEMPLEGVAINTVFAEVQQMLDNGNTVYGASFSSDATSNYAWEAIEAANRGATGFLYAIDTQSDNGIFMQVIYAGDGENVKQTMQTMVNSLR